MESKRFEESPSLFGDNVGQGTDGNVKCCWCRTEYGGREDTYGEPNSEDDPISVDYFGDKRICACCFAKVERAVIENMHRILPWFVRLLQTRGTEIQHLLGGIQNVKNLLAELSQPSK